MSDQRSHEPGMDAPFDPERPTDIEDAERDAARPDGGAKEDDPLLREGTDAPDAADIEDPAQQL